MEDESLSSVDQFLRDNGFSISDPALGLASLSGDELLDDELLSDADERAPPRFVLLDDEQLLGERLSGDRTSERRDDEPRSWAGSQPQAKQLEQEQEPETQEQEQDSLDRSMLFGGSELSLGSNAALEPQPPSDASDASSMQTPLVEEQVTPSVAMVSAASSSLPPSLPASPVHSASSGSTGRVPDQELNDALGMPRLSTGRTSEQGRSAGSGSDRRFLQIRTQRELFVDVEEKHSMQGSSHDGLDARSEHASGDRVRLSRSSSDSDGHLSLHETEEKTQAFVHEGSVNSAESEATCEREGAAKIGEGEWDGLNDLLRRNSLPAIRFRRVGSGEVLPDRDSLFSIIHDFGVQLERKNEVGPIGVKKESESSELLAKRLRNSCLRLQQQLKVSEHRVKAKEVIVDRMQAKLQQQVDKENMNKTRDRRAFRNLQDRDPRRANPRDIQALETIGAYEAQREQMQEEIEHLKTQVATLNSELRDKDNFIARQSNAALRNEPPIWDAHSLEEEMEPDPQSRFQRRHESASVASDEMMLEQLEAARREQEVAAAKLRHREAVMIKKVAMIEQELLAARETIGELKEENANLTLEAESRPSIRDYRLSQRRIHQLERQVAENKLALEEASDLNELRKYMGTKELVERDRMNHRLHLNRLNSLPRETTLGVVKHVCRVLHLTDITLIAPSLDKLCSVVAAVPRMEKFIRDVCGFVFLHLDDSTDTNSGDSSRFELEQVLPTLQQWMVERRKLHALESFKASIITELCKRSVEPSILNNEEDIRQDENVSSRPTTLSRAVHIVSELVDLEKSVMHHQKEASLVHCLTAIRERLEDDSVNPSRPRLTEKKPDNEVPDDENENTPNFVVEKRRSQPNGSGDKFEASLVGVRQVREMSILVSELKRELGASTMEEILPRTKRLMELLSLSIHNGDPEDDEDYE
ncbi:unnamed protein product [Phytophthora lilii]|uniref:Centrosomal protein of 70 kDa n=1 Tax=Phytophthora lilii TaxID=2077276 RepID=A0A9W6TZB6_9STRA|nr:unnamed protein product [Phytophthora lilii]